MPTPKEPTSLTKDMKDVSAGLVVATGLTLALRLLGRRGRLVRTVTVATVSAAAALLRHRFVHDRTTTKYSLTRKVSHDDRVGDE